MENSTIISATSFYKALGDDNRLKSLLIISREEEACVCELMVALDEDSQPKVSRHLALLRKSGILIDRKQKQWVFYSINPQLPEWMKNVIHTTANEAPELVERELSRLHKMGDRPARSNMCC